MTTFAEFRPAGATSGIPLFEHTCPRLGALYVSAAPSPPQDSYVVPLCGCRPLAADATMEQVEA